MTTIGYLSLYVALFFSAYAGLAALLGVRTGAREMIASAERAATAVFAFLSVAAAALLWALVTRDFQVAYVASYTSRSLPMSYTLAAFYAGQKGSLLFWGWILSGFTVVVVHQNRRRNRELMPWVLAVLMALCGFFLLLMVFITNPFESHAYLPADGRGLNPMLQNPGMLFHPPTLFLGYVGFSVPFAFAVAALVTGELGDSWIKTTRKWTILSWFFLTAGNLFGMEWAYVELGWGGYWAWDPVENASFMPWIVGTAYLHSVMIQEKRGMLKVWNIGLVLATFLLTIFGTFITRSGLIASVHSFGESSLGWAFLAFLGVTAVATVALLVWRLPHLKSRNHLDALLSRESSFLLNNLLFVGIAFTVLWGTLFPIISEAVRGVKITVGVPFFNSVVAPIGLALLLLTGLCPVVGWRKTSPGAFGRKILPASLLAAAAAGGMAAAGVRTPPALVTWTLCVFVAANLLLEFYHGTRTRHAAFKEPYHRALGRLVARNRRRYGGHIVHLGVVLIFMAFGASVFNTERQVTLKAGESVSVGDYALRYDGLAQYPSAGRQRVVATLSVFTEDGAQIGVLGPEKSLYQGQEQPATEVAIHSNLKEDLYVILAGYDADSATFKILINPLVIWLWLGGGVMALGTVVIMVPERRRQAQGVPAGLPAQLAEAR